jgi:hypothetical protein
MARVEISEQQWKAIQKASGLPECARERIEHLLGNYRAFQQASATEPRARQTRRELLRIAKLAENLITAITSMNADVCTTLHDAGVKEHVLAALMLRAPPRLAVDAVDGSAAPLPRRRSSLTPTRDTLNLLYKRVAAVQELRRWFEDAARSLPAEATGAHRAAENHLWLVAQLDAILAYYRGRRDRQIARSNKKPQHYVKLCFAAVDPNVGTGSIQKAIEAYVRRTPRRSSAGAQTAKKKRA